MPPGAKGAPKYPEIPLPKTDLVSCFHAGSARTGPADFEKARGELRLWNDEGKGFFVDHGKHFQMASSAPKERGISSNAAAVPFSRMQDKLRKPASINYPIPAVADHRLRWLGRFMNT